MSSFRKAQTIHRYSGGYWDDNGEWQPGGDFEELTIMASVQPLKSQEVTQYTAMMPEGGVQFSAVRIYSSTPLKVDRQEMPDGTPLDEADILVWRGRLWKVVSREDWQSDVINHFRHVAWEIEPRPEPEPEPDEEVDADADNPSTVSP